MERVIIRGMGHAFADQPSIEPAPLTPAAAQVDEVVTGWFRRYLR